MRLTMDALQRPMALLDFAFAIAPNHPLALLSEPLSSETILQHRAISAADRSRHLAPHSSGLLPGAVDDQQVAEPKPSIPLHLAWRTDHAGRALAWFVERLSDFTIAPEERQ